MKNSIQVSIATIVSISVLLGMGSDMLYAQTGTIATDSTTLNTTTNTSTTNSGTSSGESDTTSASDTTTLISNTADETTGTDETRTATGTAGTTDATISSTNATSWGVSLTDTMPPVIKLIGEAVVSINAGLPYFDLGAIAYDNTDGDITSHIKHESTVNTALPGAYHVVYEVRDRAGNIAKIARKVYVVALPSSTTTQIRSTITVPVESTKTEIISTSTIITATTSTTSSDSFTSETDRLLQIMREKNVSRVEEERNQDTEVAPSAEVPPHLQGTSTLGIPATESREQVEEKIEKVIERAVIDREETQKDSDHDGVSDYDEQHIYGTNSNVADSDEDGYSDRAEITTGFDPKNPDLHAIIVYENPKDSGEIKKELITVAAINFAERQQESENNTERRIEFKGKGLPNSFVTIYIFSTPTVVTVKTDDEGNWRYILDKELEDGNHEVHVAMTDNAGKILAKSVAIPFIKEANAITVDQNLLTPIESGSSPSLLRGKYLYILVVVVISLIGIIFVIIGIRTQPSYRRNHSSNSIDSAEDGNHHV